MDGGRGFGRNNWHKLLRAIWEMKLWRAMIVCPKRAQHIKKKKKVERSRDTVGNNLKNIQKIEPSILIETGQMELFGILPWFTRTK